MRIPAHVRILRKLGPDFKTEAVDVPILLCTTHFSRKTQNIFLSTGVFPENFELTNSGKKTEPSLRKELTSFLQIKSLHKPSIYIRIAQHMRTAHSEFVKKGNSVQSAEIPFAINPFEKLPTGRVKKPEETEFEDTDSDEPTISQTGQPEKEPCLADHISADVANQSPTREVVHEHEPACVPSAVVSELANPSTCSVDTTSDRICQCSEKMFAFLVVEKDNLCRTNNVPNFKTANKFLMSILWNPINPTLPIRKLFPFHKNTIIWLIILTH
jgi:hypothetical protein